MSETVPPQTHVGHVHLKVSDLERALEFYSGVLGFTITQRYGGRAAFLAAGDYHHHIGLNTWESAGGIQPPRGSTGLYHAAFVFPDRASLGAAIKRVQNAGVQLDGAADHGVSEAVYLRDPDGNGIELYRDRPKDEWPRDTTGLLEMTNTPLDVDALIAEAN